MCLSAGENFKDANELPDQLQPGLEAQAILRQFRHLRLRSGQAESLALFTKRRPPSFIRPDKVAPCSFLFA